MNSGKIVITLEEYRKAHNISKYKIIKHCDVSATQFNSYCNNKISRVDLPVLARICSYLDSNVPNNKLFFSAIISTLTIILNNDLSIFLSLSLCYLLGSSLFYLCRFNIVVMLSSCE